MLIRIAGFLLETVFFLLIAAALMRCYMNWLRLTMTVQPGVFVMALTNWLVKPLRRIMPRAMVQSRLDSASLIAAFLLALAYALISLTLFGLLAGGGDLSDLGGLLWISLPGLALKMLVRVALQTMVVVVLGFAILSWVQPHSPLYGLLGRLCDPLLAPLRRVVPMIGGVDLSALVLILLLQIGLMLLG
ncbi:MAG: YggT family protein [Pseudomonadota bacterium]